MTKKLSEARRAFSEWLEKPATDLDFKIGTTVVIVATLVSLSLISYNIDKLGKTLEQNQQPFSDLTQKYLEERERTSAAFLKEIKKIIGAEDVQPGPGLGLNEVQGEVI